MIPLFGWKDEKEATHHTLTKNVKDQENYSCFHSGMWWQPVFLFFTIFSLLLPANMSLKFTLSWSLSSFMMRKKYFGLIRARWMGWGPKEVRWKFQCCWSPVQKTQTDGTVDISSTKRNLRRYRTPSIVHSNVWKGILTLRRCVGCEVEGHFLFDVSTVQVCFRTISWEIPQNRGGELTRCGDFNCHNVYTS